MTMCRLTPRKAFTIIEVLVVIAVIAVLLSIVVPVLSNVRVSANRAISLSNLRTLSVQVGIYTNTFGGWYPYIEDKQAIRITPSEDDNATYLVFTPYWDFSLYWPAVMHEIAPWRESYGAWVSPRSRRMPDQPWRSEEGSNGFPSYRLLHAFFARPEVWIPGTVANPRLLRPVGSHEVSYPSKKAQFFDAERAYEPREDSPLTPLLFADSHGSIQNVSHANPPGINVFTSSSRSLYDTSSGIRGTDF